MATETVGRSRPALGRARDRRPVDGRRAATVVGVLALLGAWAWAADGLPAIVLPGPLRTWQAVVGLAESGELVDQLLLTLGRTILGSALGTGLGVVLGVSAGLSAVVDGLLAPVRLLFAGLPPVVTTVVVMIWLGPSGTVAVVAVVVAMFPHVFVAAREATRTVDRDLLEMSRAFAVPLRWRLRHVVLPATTPPVLAAVAITLSNALRLTMMAELLAATTGSGASLGLARTYLETPVVFAWTSVAVVFAVLVDWVVLGPVRRRTLAWAAPTLDR